MSVNDETKTYSEPSYALPDQDKPKMPFYLPDISKHLRPEMRRLLKEYSNIPAEEQSKHVHEIRDKAWAIRTYPCTGLGAWLLPFIPRSPAYPEILQRMRDGATFLDIGCHVGSDLRRLVFDGAPSSNMYAVDIVSHWDVGFALFNDNDRFKATFMEADLMAADTDPRLTALHHKMDIISVSAVFHQWSWRDQVTAAERVALFSKPGSIIVGHQIGNVTPHQVTQFQGMKVDTWRHDAESFVGLWDQVGSETGSQWETKARLLSWEDMGLDPQDYEWMPDGDCVLDFVVTRVA